MELILADEAGFCYGVKRALELALKASTEDGPWCTLGPLVHNREVTRFLADKGLPCEEDITRIKSGGLVIRTHGIPPETLELINSQGLKVIDATCPRVKQVQNLAKKMIDEGYQLVVVGDEDHPEVKGILGWAGKGATVIASPDEIASLPLLTRVAVVCQTTKSEDEYHRVVKELVSHTREIRAFNTVCKASIRRQEAAAELASRVEVMVVIGDRYSANTRSLVKVCGSMGVPVYHIENASELNQEWFRGRKRVGITAGASTPDWLIKEVLDQMSELETNTALSEVKGINEEDVTQESVAEEVGFTQDQEFNASETRESSAEGITEGLAAEDAEFPQEQKVNDSANEDSSEEDLTPEPVAEKVGFLQEQEVISSGTEASFAQMEAEMAENLKAVERGTILKGRVIQVTNDEVMVDVGGKSEGIIPLRELSLHEVDSAKEVVEVGDEVDVLVLRWDEDGTILVSKRRVDQERALDKLQECFAEDQPVAGTVLKTVKGGLLVDIGVVGFLPASQVEEGYVRNLEDYVGQELRFKILEYNRNKRRGSQVVLSRRKLLEEERKAERDRFWEEVAEGQTKKGRVKRLTDYGAFVDVGGFEGLLHISEIDHARIEKPANVLSEGQEIEVFVLSADRETERVSLSRKRILPSPWENITERYEPGKIVTGEVVRLASFGAFIELEPGVDGLVHISQLANHRVAKTEDAVEVGQAVKIKVLSVDPIERRIALSIKEAEEGADLEFTREYLDGQDDEEFGSKD